MMMTDSAVSMHGEDDMGRQIVRVLYDGTYYEGRACSQGGTVFAIIFDQCLPSGACKILHDYFSESHPDMDYTLCA